MVKLFDLDGFKTMKHIEPRNGQRGIIMQKSSFFNASFRKVLSFSVFGLGFYACVNSATAADLAASLAPQSQASSVNDAGVCGYKRILWEVGYKFRQEVHNVPGLPVVHIDQVKDIEMTRGENPATKLNIPRQFCRATAIMNDGSSYPLYYMVEYGQGFTGVGGYNVEFCVEGFDKWRIQDGNCRAVK